MSEDTGAPAGPSREDGWAEERNNLEDQCRRLREQQQLTAQRHDHLRRFVNQAANTLSVDIAPSITFNATAQQLRPVLAVFVVHPGREWRLIRCQLRSYAATEIKLLNEVPEANFLVCSFVPHAVNFGTRFKEILEERHSISGTHNTLRLADGLPDIEDDVLVDVIQEVLTDPRRAADLLAAQMRRAALDD